MPSNTPGGFTCERATSLKPNVMSFHVSDTTVPGGGKSRAGASGADAPVARQAPLTIRYKVTKMGRNWRIRIGVNEVVKKAPDEMQ